MARRTFIVCDACSSTSNVQGYKMTREDGSRLNGDLCESCWKSRILTLKPTAVASHRRQFHVYEDESEIPTSEG